MSANETALVLYRYGRSFTIQYQQSATTSVLVNLSWADWPQYAANWQYEHAALRFTPGNTNYRVWYNSAMHEGTAAADTPMELDLGISAADFAAGTGTTARFYRSLSAWSEYYDIELVIYATPLVTTVDSTVVVDDAILGQAQTVRLTNTDESATHRVRWTYGNVTSGWQAYGAATRAPAWAVPSASIAAVLAANTTSSTVTGTVEVETWTAGGTLVGMTTTPARLRIPYNSDTRMEIGAVSSSAVSTAPQLPAGALPAGTLVAGYCTITVQTGTVTCLGGQSLAALWAETPDGTVQPDAQSPPAFTIQPATAGAYPIRIVWEDSRGNREQALIEDYTIAPYRPPVITAVERYRCDSAGNEDDEGAWVSLTVSASMETMGGAFANALTVAARVTDSAGRQVIALTALSGGAGILGGSLDPEAAYTVTITVEDLMGGTDSMQVRVDSARYIIHRMAGGEGLGFGQAATEYGLTVNPDWPVRVHGAEILRLIRDTAHPTGSLLRTVDPAYNPNTAMPGTLWGRAADTTEDGRTVYTWIRGR